MIKGYKCFDKGLVNRYGEKFEVGKVYHCYGEIRFGPDGNGFHFCANLEDTLRFFDCSNGIEICEVTGFGEVIRRNDDYNDYYDMYVSDFILINKLLTREEIISYALSLGEMRVYRFLTSYKLTEEEKLLFLDKYKNSNYVLDAISYYQYNDKDVYTRRLEK